MMQIGSELFDVFDIFYVIASICCTFMCIYVASAAYLAV